MSRTRKLNISPQKVMSAENSGNENYFNGWWRKLWKFFTGDWKKFCDVNVEKKDFLKFRGNWETENKNHRRKVLFAALPKSKSQVTDRQCSCQKLYYKQM